MTDRGLTRRDFLAHAAAVAGATALGCKSDSTIPDIVTKGSVDHIIVVTMENRSFDHLLGWLPKADGKQSGLSFRDSSGAQHSTWHLTSTNGCGLRDPAHGYTGGRTEYNNGACDGWLITPGNDLHSIGYYDSGDLPFLSKAATQWLVLDRYFAPFMGPTVPNRLISLAAQTDRLEDSLVESTLPTIWDRLIAAGRTCRNYGSGLVSSVLWGARYSAIMEPITNFYSAAAAGTLPDVSYVDPELPSETANSYHPPGDIRNGEAFLSSVYNAVTKSPLWKSSLLIITFDEWGGFFDHVPPPVAPILPGEQALGITDGLRGFRVPTIMISPFVSRGAVSSKVYDHTSILKMIETRWNLTPLTLRDQNANDLTAELDLSLQVKDAPAFDVPEGPFSIPCTAPVPGELS